MNRDRERAIEQDCARLVSRYANLLDVALWDELSQLFSENGRMARPSAPEDWVEGRSAILQSLKARPPRKTRHLCTNIVIDVVSETEARGECALALYTGTNEFPKLGYFRDRFVLTAEGWKFLERSGGMTF